MFNRLIAVGTPERVAFGFNSSGSPHRYERLEDWPPPPVIAPPLMVRDFNFTALSDAI
jgi:hypothetical protein